MAYVDIVTALAVLQYLVFGFQVGRARGRFGVKAPASSGHEIFDRYYRVQMNTLELLPIFLVGLYLFSHYWNPIGAAVLGLVYLIGRQIYAYAYVQDPAKRELGFILSMLPVTIMVLGGLVGAGQRLL